MGIVNPRPAIRKREARMVARRLARHANIMRQLENEGMTREAASKRAFEIIQEEDRSDACEDADATLLVLR